MKKHTLLLGIAITALIIAGVLVFFAWPKVAAKLTVESTLREQESFANMEISTDIQKKDETPKDQHLSPLQSLIARLPLSTPNEILLDVPYVCQNPFRNEEGWKWHDNSCEEAAALQAVLYLRSETITPQEAHEQFLHMITWQEQPEHFGEHKDLYDEELRIFIRDYFSLADEAVIWIPELTLPLTKRILSAGYPIVVPVTGKDIKNPFYHYQGYHMLTAIGYREDTIITNDNGTKRGEKYPYNADIFFTANATAGGGGVVIIHPEEE